MEALLAAINHFCGRRRDGCSDEQVAVDLIYIRHAVDLLEVEFSDDAAEFATTDVYDRHGSTTFIDWIRHNCHMTGPAAAARVAVGNNLERLPASLGALYAREIGFAHLIAMARTADGWCTKGSGSWSGRAMDLCWPYHRRPHLDPSLGRRR